MIHKDIYGLVLAGGRSVRMGTDKGLLDYNGKPQREFMFDLLSKVCEKVFTSCRKEQNVPDSLNPIPDKFEYEGPINGILSGIQTNQGKAWLIIAVDMPYVDLQALLHLLNNRDQSKVATCYLHEAENFPEPLLTLWEPAAYSKLDAYATAGNISPRYFLESNAVKIVKPTNNQILVNINTPKER
jgi:molybdopterin-guanine dinucleotide biosynthesis protein A